MAENNPIKLGIEPEIDLTKLTGSAKQIADSMSKALQNYDERINSVQSSLTNWSTSLASLQQQYASFQNTYGTGFAKMQAFAPFISELKDAQQHVANLTARLETLKTNKASVKQDYMGSIAEAIKPPPVEDVKPTPPVTKSDVDILNEYIEALKHFIRERELTIAYHGGNREFRDATAQELDDIDRRYTATEKRAQEFATKAFGAMPPEAAAQIAAYREQMFGVGEQLDAVSEKAEKPLSVFQRLGRAFANLFAETAGKELPYPHAEPVEDVNNSYARLLGRIQECKAALRTGRDANGNVLNTEQIVSTMQELKGLERELADIKSQATITPDVDVSKIKTATGVMMEMRRVQREMNSGTLDGQGMLQAEATMQALIQRKAELDAANEKNHSSSSRASKGLFQQSAAAKQLTKSLNKLSGKFKHGLTNIMKYAFGVRSVFFLYRKLRQAATQAMTSIANTFKDSDFSKYFFEFMNNLNRLKGDLGTFVEPIATAILPALNALMNALSATIVKIAEFIATLTGRSSIYRAQVEQLDEVAGSASNAGEALASLDKLSVISSGGGGGGGSSASNGLKNITYTEQAIENASSLAQILKEAWSNNDLAKWLEFGETIGSNLTTSISNGLNGIDWDDIKAKAGGIGTALGGFINTTLGDKSFTESIGGALGNAISTAFTGINTFLKTTDFQNLGSSIVNGISAFLRTVDGSVIGNAIMGLVTGAFNFVTGMNKELGGLTDSLFSVIEGIVAGLFAPENVANLTRSMANGLLSTISSTLTVIPRAITGIISVITGAITGSSGLGDAFSSSFEGFGEDIAGMFSGVGAAWTDAFNHIQAFFSRFGTIIGTFIKDIVSGKSVGEAWAHATQEFAESYAHALEVATNPSAYITIVEPNIKSTVQTLTDMLVEAWRDSGVSTELGNEIQEMLVAAYSGADINAGQLLSKLTIAFHDENATAEMKDAISGLFNTILGSLNISDAAKTALMRAFESGNYQAIINILASLDKQSVDDAQEEAQNHLHTSPADLQIQLQKGAGTTAAQQAVDEATGAAGKAPVKMYARMGTPASKLLSDMQSEWNKQSNKSVNVDANMNTSADTLMGKLQNSWSGLASSKKALSVTSSIDGRTESQKIANSIKSNWVAPTVEVGATPKATSGSTLASAISSMWTALPSTRSGKLIDTIAGVADNTVTSTLPKSIDALWKGVRSNHPLGVIIQAISGTSSSLGDHIASQIDQAIRARHAVIQVDANLNADKFKEAIRQAVMGVTHDTTIEWTPIKVTNADTLADARAYLSLYGKSQRPTIKWNARGGILDSATLIGAGEAGKEAIVPLERNIGWMKTLSRQLVERMNINAIPHEVISALMAIKDAIVNLPRNAIASGMVLPAYATSGAMASTTKDDIKAAIQEVFGATGFGTQASAPIVLQVNSRTLAELVWDETNKRYRQLGR